MKKFLVILIVIAILVAATICGVRLYKDYKAKINIGIEQKIEDTARRNGQSNNMILYNGIEMNIETGVQDLIDMTITDEAKERYNTTYYNFEHSKYTGTTLGEFGEETYEGVSVVTNVGRIAMTQKYEAVPREYKEVDELKGNLKLDYTDIEINEVDLDGDGKNEYIVCYKIDEEDEAYSSIMLLNSEWEKITDLVTLPDGFWANMEDDEHKIFLSLEDVDYIDIDQDDVMEILIKVPIYEGTRVSIVKYNKGELEGEFELSTSVDP